MTVKEAICKLTPKTSPMPKEAIQLLRENWKEAEPLLLKALDDTITNPLSEPPALFDYALFLCAEMRSEAAFDRYIKICKLPIALIDILISDLLTESLEALLTYTCLGRIDSLKAVIEEESNDEYARAAALDAIRNLVINENYPLIEFKKYCIELLEYRLELLPGFIWEELISISSDLGLNEAIPLIKVAYAHELLEYPELSCEEVEFYLKKNRDKPNLKTPRGATLESTEEEMFYANNWPKNTITLIEDEEKFINTLFEQKEVSDRIKTITASKPTGRNDPCPCGSGKKHKKCCINNPDDADSWEAPEPTCYADNLIDCGYFNHERDYELLTLFCWLKAWRNIVDEKVIPDIIITPSDSACDQFDCCESFAVWLKDLIKIIVKAGCNNSFNLNESLKTIPEIISKFPAMDSNLRQQAEYALAMILAKAGQPEEAKKHFDLSLKYSEKGSSTYFIHSVITSFNANKLHMPPNWEKALKYAKKAKELSDDALRKVMPFDEHIENIKNTMAMRATRARLRKKHS